MDVFVKITGEVKAFPKLTTVQSASEFLRKLERKEKKGKGKEKKKRRKEKEILIMFLVSFNPLYLLKIRHILNTLLLPIT